MTDLAPFAGVDDLLDTLERPVGRDRALLAVARASGAIRGFCHWSISTEVVADAIVNARRLSGSFWLPTLWLADVTEVVEGGVTLTPHTDYEWDASGRVVRASGYWTPYLGSLVVSYTHGYPDGDHRLAPVHDICLAAASRLVANPQGRTSEATGQESWSASGSGGGGGTLSGDEERLLGPLVLDW